MALDLCVFFGDEIDDPRSSNEYIVTVECILIPRIVNMETDIAVKPYHLPLEFPKAVKMRHCPPVMR